MRHVTDSTYPESPRRMMLTDNLLVLRRELDDDGPDRDIASSYQ